MKHHDKSVRRIIWGRAKAAGISIKEFVNVGNHIHLVVVLPMLRVWKEFIRSVTGLIARRVMSAERGKKSGMRFWTGRPWTRLVAWGRDYFGIRSYLALNKIEALGFSRNDAKILQKMNLEGVVLRC